MASGLDELKRLIRVREIYRAKLASQLAKVDAELEGMRQGLAVIEGSAAKEHPADESLDRLPN